MHAILIEIRTNSRENLANNDAMSVEASETQVEGEAMSAEGRGNLAESRENHAESQENRV